MNVPIGQQVEITVRRRLGRRRKLSQGTLVHVEVFYDPTTDVRKQSFLIEQEVPARWTLPRYWWEEQ